MTSEEQRASEQPTGAVIPILFGVVVVWAVAGLALAWRWGWI
jgi:membrane protein insertase Oxa1/YidC/SpoIIIJ